MLLNYPQFLTRLAVRSPAHLLNPPVVASSEISIPRGSTIHYLNYKDDTLFPERSINYLSGVKDGKRVPVWCVTELARLDETAMVSNRTLQKQIRLWRQDNAQDFRFIDLFDAPNADVQTNAIISYQALRNLYNYKGSATASVSRYTNVYTTYWQGVHKALVKDLTGEQFVQIPVPVMLPSKSLLDNLLKYPLSTYARVVTDPDLAGVIELYKYLNKATRESSTLSSITEEDTKRITVELTHQGYSCFFKLSFLVGLSDESAIESKQKMEVKQLQRLFLLMALKVQKKVYDTQNTEAVQSDEASSDQDSAGIDENDEDNEDAQEYSDGQTAAYIKDNTTEFISRGKQVKASGDKTSSALADLDLGELKVDDISEFEGSSDDIFAKLMLKKDEPALKAVSFTDKQTEPKPTLDDEEDVEPAKPVADYSPERKELLLKTKSLDENFEEYLDLAKTSGAVSTIETRALKKLFEQRRVMKSPYKDALLDEHKVVTTEDVALPESALKLSVNNNLVDDALKTETVFNFDRLYLDKLLQKDVLGCVTQIEQAGVIIKDYQVERNDSALGSYEVHKLTLKPYKGKESTVYFRLPVINAEGEFTASSIRYRMRKQRTDNPLRKISPSKVAITSNYGKLFVERTERKSYDPYAQLSDYIKQEYLAGSGVISSVSPGNCFDNYSLKPNDFSAMSQQFKQVATPTYTFVFDRQEALLTVKPEVIDQIESSGKLFFVGYINTDKSLLVMDMASQVYALADTQTPIGSLASLLGMDMGKVPVQFSTIKVLGDTLALGVVIAYYVGLKGLLELTDTDYEVLGARKQVQLTKDTIVLKLEDAKLVATADTPLKKLLLGGFAFYKDTLKTLSLQSLESGAVYLSLFEQRGSTLMHLRELDLLRQLFVDPITKDVLKSIGEPQEYLPVLMRACQMLSDFKHPDINDPEHSRIRGYDRVPGLMYRVLSQSVRTTKLGMSKGKIELDPYGVWNAITQDTTVKIVEDSNPITDVKEAEAVTFTGADGLNKSSTPEGMRRYHKNDIGLISEATVDSSDVALNIYLTPYAKLENLRGKVAVKKQERQDTVFSTSVLLTPMGEQDDQYCITLK